MVANLKGDFQTKAKEKPATQDDIGKISFAGAEIRSDKNGKPETVGVFKSYFQNNYGNVEAQEIRLNAKQIQNRIDAAAPELGNKEYPWTSQNMDQMRSGLSVVQTLESMQVSNNFQPATP